MVLSHETTSEQEKEDRVTDTIKVLCIDDEEDFVTLTGLYLEKLSVGRIKPTTVLSADQALLLLEQESFDVIVSDYQMPGMHGLELLDHLRKQGNSIPFIILTGRGREEVVIQALNLGVNFYVQKISESNVLFTELVHYIIISAEKKRVQDQLNRNRTRLVEQVKLLQVSDARYQSLVEHTSESLFCYEYNPPIPVDLSIDGQIEMFYHGILVDCNDIAAKSYGSTKASEVLGKSLLELFNAPPGSLDDFFRNFIQNGYRTVNAEASEVAEDGSRRYFLNNGHAVIKNGHVKRVWGSYREITDLKKGKQTEQALRESEAKHASVLRVAPIGIGAVHDRVFSFVSDTFLDMVGYSREELLGQNARMVYPSDEEYERVGNKKYAEIRKSGTGSINTRFKCKDGSIIDVDLRSTPVDHSDLSKSVIFTALDITERKRVERKLRESEARYRSLFEYSPVPLWEENFSELERYFDELHDSGVGDFRAYFDTNPGEVVKCSRMIKIIDVNKATVDMYRARSKRDLVGNLDRIFTDESLVAFKEELIGIAERKQEFTIEIVNRTLTGNEILVELNWSILPYRGDDYSNVIISTTDITGRRKAEEAADFLHSLLRHDINNKMAVIHGYLSLLKEAGLTEEQLEFTEKVIRSCSNGMELIDKISSLRRIDVARLEETGDVDAVAVLVETVKVLEDRAADARMELKMTRGTGELMVQGGPLLKELFYNLVENSVVHSKGTRLRITVKEKDGHVTIILEDDGVGIPDDIKERIFKRGFKGLDSKGSGLGLFLVKTIIEAYNGDIAVKNAEPRGTRFEVVLKKSTRNN
ncbi:MAG: PAS domain S-box protein [Candidatus Hodarchaeales archaeon]|jgi:PAS domain S-box-containing protein